MSISEWKKMPRKQQELVLAVWDKVLQTIKFQQASKTDFMADNDYPDMLGPKDTPFDIALKALQEISGSPKFFHGCPGCVFLGTIEQSVEDKFVLTSPHNPNFKSYGPFDLYFCDQKRNRPTVTVRIKDAPKPTDRAGSLTEALYGDFGQDDGYLSEDADKDELQPVFSEAVARAKEAGLL